MRVNGYINYQIETGGGTDPETGFPIPVVTSWSADIPCLFSANTRADKGTYIDGKFTIASYLIDIEMQDLPTFDTIRLTDLRGNVLGFGEPDERKFSSIVIEYLDIAGRIRITA